MAMSNGGREVAAASKMPRGGRKSHQDVGPYNFKEHFDSDILEYVCEDTRLSTLQRKLVRENNSLISHALACQISDVLYYMDNRAYVFRSYEVICDAAFEVIHSSKHGDKVKSETSRAISRVGFVLSRFCDGEFETFWKWYDKVWERFYEGTRKEKDLVYYIKIFQVLLTAKPHLQENVAKPLMDNLQEILEKTENHLLVPPLMSCLALISQQQPRLFEPRFQDVVDILVGWHVDIGQSPTLKTHISSVLLSWHSYWIIDLDFSAGLLRQFVEDIEAFTDEITEGVEGSDENLSECIEKIASVVQVFNSVLSCLRSKSKQKAVSFLPSESSKWGKIILNCLLQTLEKRLDEDVVLAGQQSLLMLLERMESLFRDNEAEMIAFYKICLESIKQLSYKGQNQTLIFATKMICHVDLAKHQQLEFVTMALDADLVVHGAMTNDRVSHEAIVKFFRDLLRSKNINVLQEAYSALLVPFKAALKDLCEPCFQSRPHQEKKAIKVLLFVLECLKELAITKGSVLSMWALNPPIFQLLNSAGVSNANFARKHPFVHTAVLKMFKLHTSSHHHFLASSQLLSTNQLTAMTMAPTADFFQVLIKTLVDIIGLIPASDLSLGSEQLMQEWILEVLQTASKSFVELKSSQEFDAFLAALLSWEKSAIIEGLIDYFNFEKNGSSGLNSKANQYYPILLGKLDSTRTQDRDSAIKLLPKMAPLAIDCLSTTDATSTSSNSSNNEEKKGFLSAKLHLQEEKPELQSLRLRTPDFKLLSDLMILGPMKELETNINEGEEEEGDKLGEILQGLTDVNHACKLQGRQAQVQWSGEQIAAFCISNKLKTSFGKAQETLSAYERTMRSLANTFGKQMAPLPPLGKIRQARNFLVVFETLEKAMYQAFDGSNISAFFVANKKTCLDWLSRMRLMTAHVAFALGEFAFALRQSRKALQKDQQHAVDEDLLAIAAISMKNLDNGTGAENINGLYTWAAETHNKKFRWMKGLMALAKGKHEEGIQLIKAYLERASAGFNSAKGICYNLLCKEIVLAHFALCDFANYSKLIEDYKEQSSQLDAGGLHCFSNEFYANSLEALCTFDHVSLSKIDDTYEAKTIEDLVLIEQNRQLVYNASRTSQLKGILENVALTRTQLKKVLITASVKTMCDNLLDHHQNCDLTTFLTYEERTHSTESLLLIKKWGDYFIRLTHQKPELHFQLNALNLEIAIQARKEHNFNLAKRHLEQNLGCDANGDQKDLVNYISGINFNNPLMYLSTDKANCLRQSAKLAYVLQGNKLETGDKNMNKMVAVQVLCGISTIGLRCVENHDLATIASRSFNTLAKWLKRNPQLMDPDVVVSCNSPDAVTLTQILAHQPISEALDDENALLSTETSSDGDMVIGRLLRLATLMAPNLAKVWYEFASWSLEMGEKVLASSINGCVPLTNEEEARLKAVNGLSKVQLKELTDVISQVHLKQIQTTAEIEVDKTEFMRKTLASTCFGFDSSGLLEKESLEVLLKLWQDVQKRIFYYQEVATSSYFTFISLSQGREGKEQRVISATLRLLQLIVKHSFELQESLESLDQTPSHCWRSIIPQLFSRLNHPVKVVRGRISDLLCRIGSDHPNWVIFPAVVGSIASETVKVGKLFEEEVLEHEGKDLEGHDVKVVNDQGNADNLDVEMLPEMQSAHEKIVHMMFSRIPESVEHVKILVSQLQRISILWDELWFGTIQQYNPEVSRRVKKMEEEAKRLAKNESLNADEKRALVKDKYNILFKPVLYVLNKVEDITKNPQSPSELWFFNRFGKFICEMMTKLRDPPDYTKPKEVWSLLSELQSKIAAKLLRKGHLQLSEISPALSTLKDTLIPLPGHEDEISLTVKNFENILTILPTKTKPKKLKVKANDGKGYTYLFKGLEDLHLDERIMQFLSIANTLMKKSGFNARHYSVVPLGPRSGLIQWVEGAVPMFSLYKKWHQRRQTIMELTKKSSTAEQRSNIPAKPADQFYNKLIPLLRDQGIHNLDNRKEWPLAVMRQVLFELMDETPKDLLSLQLWLSSKDSNDWHRVSSNLIRSIAVMSVIGYIIGLGDRHLDNLLVDFQKGEIIHIDYNVCFEKGAKLRIPERVPCRLTQNIVNLFGPTGVEGLFRLSCEKTLEILRGGKETLLTLLEAFIYDPLVDWTPGVELGLAGAFAKHNPDGDGNQLVQDKRDMQAEITFSMLSVRVAEMKGSWMDNKASLVKDLTSINDVLMCWDEELRNIQILRESLTKQHKSISILKEAEANPTSHKLYALQDRYAEHRAVETAVESSKNQVMTFIEEHEKVAMAFQRVSNNLSSQLQKWNNELSHLDIAHSLSGIVAEFLRSAGQIPLLDQLQNVETGFRIGIDKLRASLSLGLQLFGHCTTMISMYPQSAKDEHRVTFYLKWMQNIIDDFTIDSCTSVVNEFNVKFVEVNPDLRRHHVVSLNYQLETWAQEIHFRLQTIFKTMISQGIENSKAVVDAGLLIQNEAATYILNYKGLCQALCYKQLVASKSKLQNLEELIVKDQFTSQMLEDQLLLDQLLVEVNICDQVLLLMEKFELDFQETDNQTVKKKLHAFANVFKQFKNMIGSYFAVILQEGLKSCQQEKSMDVESAKIEAIIGETTNNLTDVINGVEKNQEASLKVAANIKDKFVNYIQELGSKTGALTSGQMIIMAINALLDNIDTALGDVDISPEKLLASQLSRLLTLRHFFALCFRSRDSFKADTVGQLFPSGDDMGYPVVNYMALYYIRNMKGCILSLLDKLVHLENQNVDQYVEIKILEARDKGQFLSLEMAAIFANLRKSQVALHLEHKVEILNANQQINQLLRNSFQWFHEDSLPMDAINIVPPTRLQVLSDLSNCLSALSNTQKELSDIHGRYTELNNTIEQRLKWACGANPDLQEVFDKFSSTFSSEMEVMKSILLISRSMSSSANTVMQQESLRTTTREALTADSQVMALFAECQQSATLQETLKNSQELGALELSIFSINPPEDLIDQKWIKNTADIVAKKARATTKEMEESKTKLKSTQHSLQSRIYEFKKTLTSHQKLMADVGALLRSIEKAEELDVPEIKSYLGTYRSFTDKIASMLKKLSDEMNEEKVAEVANDVEDLKDKIPEIYDHLISLASNLKDENIEQFKVGAQVTSEATKGGNNEVNVNNAEEKNAFALSVLRRIKTKLDGREPDVLRKSSVAEQVDFIIREATNVDNLALLYEGWTAWI